MAGGGGSRLQSTPHSDAVDDSAAAIAAIAAAQDESLLPPRYLPNGDMDMPAAKYAWVATYTWLKKNRSPVGSNLIPMLFTAAAIILTLLSGAKPDTGPIDDPVWVLRDRLVPSGLRFWPGPAVLDSDPASGVVGFLPPKMLWLSDPLSMATEAGVPSMDRGGGGGGIFSALPTPSPPYIMNTEVGAGGSAGGGGGSSMDGSNVGTADAKSISGWFLKVISRPAQFFMWVPAPLRSRQVMLAAITIIAVMVGLLSSLVRYVVRACVRVGRVGV